MSKTVHAYVALLCADGTEPHAGSGYVRADLGEITADQLDQIPMMHQIEFPEILSPGYNPISAFGVFDHPTNGMLLKIWQLPEAVKANIGEIPVIHHGKLLRGVEVHARILSQSEDSCGLRGGFHM